MSATTGVSMLAGCIEWGFSVMKRSGKAPDMIEMGVKEQDAQDLRGLLAEHVALSIAAKAMLEAWRDSSATSMDAAACNVSVAARALAEALGEETR